MMKPVVKNKSCLSDANARDDDDTMRGFLWHRQEECKEAWICRVNAAQIKVSSKALWVWRLKRLQRRKSESESRTTQEIRNTSKRQEYREIQRGIESTEDSGLFFSLWRHLLFAVVFLVLSNRELLPLLEFCSQRTYRELFSPSISSTSDADVQYTCIDCRACSSNQRIQDLERVYPFTFLYTSFHSVLFSANIDCRMYSQA